MAREAVIYTRDNCKSCIATKSKFDNYGVPYTEVNVEHVDRKIAEGLVAEGWRAMPVVVYRNEAWSGYRPDLIESLAEV